MKTYASTGSLLGDNQHPDLESSTSEELMAVRARLTNMLKRLGTGWCLHMEARRRVADVYPKSDIANPVAWLVDQERRALFDAAGSSFETDHIATLTWLPPQDDSRKAENFLFQNRVNNNRDRRETLALFQREIGILVDLMADALPEASLMSDGETLTYLHACISPKSAICLSNTKSLTSLFGARTNRQPFIRTWSPQS